MFSNKIIYFICFLIINYTKINCFNLDINYAIIYNDPYKYNNNSDNLKSSYFGYSIVLYPGNHYKAPWIQIGAPCGNDPRLNYKNSGVVFRCGIGEKCSLLYVDSDPDIVRTNKGPYINKLDNAWIGATMDINYKFERFVICGYRWINIKRSANSRNDDYRMQGACYWSHIEDNSTQKLLPLLDYQRDIYTDRRSGSSVYYFAQGEAGFSAHMPPDKKELLIGAPGVFNWDGTTLIYRDLVDFDPIASKLRVKRFASVDEFADVNIANAPMTSDTIANELLGYTVSSGYFYNKEKLLYVSSAPRSKHYLGKVLIFDFAKSNDRPLDVKESKQGTQLGEYFGGSVTVGDVNGDGYDDLIVGSPYYMAKKYNEGRIHVFLGSSKGKLQIPDKGDVIIGEFTSAQFGANVQFLGDIDRDGFGDVAVAAPYETDNRGAVYIFRGSNKGLDLNPCQKLEGKHFSEDIRGFGSSISRPADIDFNRYLDVAFGAYLSGHTVLLRSRPPVTVYHSLTSLINRLDYNEKNFQIEACYWFHLDQINYYINITRTIVVDEQFGRASLQGKSPKLLKILPPNRKICEQLTINLKSDITNLFDPITIILSHEFLENDNYHKVLLIGDTISGSDHFCPRCPVYDKYQSSSPTTETIPFVLGCGPDNMCSSYLEMGHNIRGIKNNTFILGSSDYISLECSIGNSGEKAYLTQLIVHLPETINYRQIPPFCVLQNITSVICNVENPLKENSQKTIILDLDMKNINSGNFEETSINISLLAITTSKNNNNKNLKIVQLFLKREADITINGKSGEQSYYYKDIEEEKINFTQIYQIEKFGASPIDEISIELLIPHLIYNNNKPKEFIRLFSPIGYLGGQPINCKSNFSYLVEGIQIKPSEILIENSSQRFIRDVSLKKFNLRENNNHIELIENRTFFINCSTNDFNCSKIICLAGPFKLKHNIAVIELKMILDISAIKYLMNEKDFIYFTCNGLITITQPSNFIQNGQKSDITQVSSLFVGQPLKQDIQIWITILSITIGLLLLLLIILVLIKVGFFRRTKHDELVQLKAETSNNENKEENKIINETNN